MDPNLLAGRRFPWTVVSLGLLALSVRLLYLHGIQDSPLFTTPVVDAGTYVADARYLNDESWLGRPAPFWQPPLYPYALALLFRICGDNLLIPRLLQAILGAAVCILTYLIGRGIFSPAVALAAGLAAALYGPLIYFGGELLPVIPAIFLDLVLVLLLLRASPGGRWPWFLAGLLLSLAALTVANILLFLPFLLLWLWLARRREGIAPRRIAQQSVLLLGGCLLVISPVTLRNYWVGGDWVLISHNAGINFYIGNNPDYDCTVEIRPGEDWARLADMPEQEAGIERLSAKSRFFFARAWGFIASEPLTYSRLLLRKLCLFWRGDEIRRNLDPYFARRDSLLLSALLWKRGLAFPFGLVAPLALVGLVAFWRSPAGRAPGGRLLILFLLVYAASVVLFFVTSRYRLPAVPLLLLFAGWGAQECLNRHRKALIALPILLLLTNVGAGAMDMEGEPQQHFWLGYAYEQKGMPANAIREYRTVLQRHPAHENALLRLAALYGDQREYLKAIEIYRQFLRFFPESERARFLLANAYLQVQQYGRAVVEYETLVPLLPNWAELYGRLGYAHLMAGHLDRAASAYRRTIKLSPDSSLVRYQLIRLYQAEGDLQAAVEECRVLVSQEPHRAEYRAYLANLLIEQESAGRESILLERTSRTRQAAEQLREAIRMDPDYVLSYWSLGLLLARQDRYAEATGFFEKTAALTPEDAQVHACLGNLYERTGRKAEAEERFARSARLDQQRRLQSRAQSEMEEQMEKIRTILENMGG